MILDRNVTVESIGLVTLVSTYREFLSVQSDMGFDEIVEMTESLLKNRMYIGGGGASPVYVVRIADGDA